MICIEVPKTGKDTPEMCKSSFWTLRQISTQPIGEPRDPGSILPIKLDSTMQQAARLPKRNAQALKRSTYLHKRSLADPMVFDLFWEKDVRETSMVEALMRYASKAKFVQVPSI